MAMQFLDRSMARIEAGELGVGDCGEKKRLGFKPEGELFDDGVGEDLARDPVHFEFGCFRCERVVEGEQEVLSLADVGDAFVFHATEGSGDGLALSIEYGAFQSDINVGLHGTDYSFGRLGATPRSYRLTNGPNEANDTFEARRDNKLW